MTTPKSRLYWLLQIVGWGAYCLVNYLSLPLFDLKIPFAGFTMVVSAVVGVMVTHGYRACIRRWKWGEMSFVRQVPRVLIGAAAVMLAYNVVQSLFGMALGIAAALSGMDIQGYASGKSFGGYVFLSMINIYAVMLIWSLIYFVYHTFEKLHQAQINQLTYETRLHEAELAALKAQLNPHFLFNALNSIRALTLVQPEAARTAITQLSDLLRASLNASHRPLIPLEEELRMVRDYLAIEQVRFEDRLQVRMEVEPAANTAQIPPLLIQTLVENALKHGISQRVAGGYVHVFVRVAPPNRLEIEVYNTGTYAPDSNPDSGLGLDNLTRRLAALYGPSATFSIAQSAPEVVLASVSMPLTA